jgi:hypothetical protein
MAYSIVGIANLALMNIGVGAIASLTEGTVQSINCNNSWEYIRDEVLSKRDWKFAKTRVALAKNATDPANGYLYAYTLPTDFLRLCLTKKDDRSVTMEDTTLGSGHSFAIETLSDGTICLMTDYDDTDYDLFITYIRKVIDPTKYSPLFIKTVSYRWAATIAITRTETRAKFADMMSLYESSLKEADNLDSSMEYIEDETGSSTSWELAGR